MFDPYLGGKEDLFSWNTGLFLLQSITDLQEAVTYIDWKQNFYDDVLSGKTEYYSNLIK